MSLEIFKYLVDAPEADEIENWFHTLFEYLNHHPEEDRWQVLNALNELTERQWESRVLLNEIYKKKVEDWVNKNWEINSEEYQQTLLSIISFLALKNSYGYISSKYLDSEKLSPELKEQFSSRKEEIEKMVIDPYYGDYKYRNWKQYDLFELRKDLNPLLIKGMQGLIMELMSDDTYEVEFVKDDGTNYEFEGQFKFIIDKSYMK